jgi:flagellar basal body-associated protein FliL
VSPLVQEKYRGEMACDKRSIIIIIIIIIIILDKQLVSEEGTFLWLSNGDLKAETKSEIVAAQDKSTTNKLPCNKNTANRNRLQFEETADRVISVCPILAKEQYIKRH